MTTLTTKLTITKANFLEWYYNYGQDSENAELRNDLANSIIDQLFKTGNGSISVNELFDNCNQDAIQVAFFEEFDDQSEGEVSDVVKKYEITLI